MTDNEARLLTQVADVIEEADILRRKLEISEKISRSAAIGWKRLVGLLAQKGNSMKVKEKEEILGALARGYCSKENKKKQLDADLIRGMEKEIVKLIEKNYTRKA